MVLVHPLSTIHVLKLLFLASNLPSPLTPPGLETDWLKYLELTLTRSKVKLVKLSARQANGTHSLCRVPRLFYNPWLTFPEGVPAYKHPYGWTEYIRNIIILTRSHTNCLQPYKPNVWNNRKVDYLIDTTNFSLSADKIIIFYILKTPFIILVF